MSDWRPIETAPREEWINTVLLAREGRPNSVMPGVFDGDEWRSISIIGLGPYLNPTHWQPLPEPPESK